MDEGVEADSTGRQRRFTQAGLRQADMQKVRHVRRETGRQTESAGRQASRLAGAQIHGRWILAEKQTGRQAGRHCAQADRSHRGGHASTVGGQTGRPAGRETRGQSGRLRNRLTTQAGRPAGRQS